MKSNYTHIGTLISAILAFVPILAVDYFLDSYIQVRERATMQRTLEGLSTQIQQGTASALDAVGKVIADSPSLCTPTFLANARATIVNNLFVRQIAVEGTDGSPYCEASGSGIVYSPLTASLSLPGRSGELSSGKLGDLPVPALKLSEVVGTRRVSAYIPVALRPENGLLSSFHPESAIQITLTNGSPILRAGDMSLFANTSSSDVIVAETFAGELPIRLQVIVPFAGVRADYASLRVGLVLVTCLMSASFLIMGLHFVRGSHVPSFELERAIAAGEIKPYYQPTINLRTGELVGCEVLCRWERPNGDVVTPGSFIELAEKTGLAIPMTLSLMQQSRTDLEAICRQLPEFKMSINLFDGHFRDTSVVEDVKVIFSGSTIRFDQLVFEITERQPVNTAMAHRVIAGLHALGARLAMDDVGTGHSNLAVMQTLGVDVIKIDKVFVDTIKETTSQLPVLDGLIAMARDLDTDIVAEGVETEVQARYLRAKGIVKAQGYLFSPALTKTAFYRVAQGLMPSLQRPSSQRTAA